MHARFNLNPALEDWSSYFTAGNRVHQENEAIVKKDLEKFKNADGVLQASEIIDSWFPKIQANVFLSHSHKDERMVIGFAGWLNEKFGIKSFIDSAVWGYSDKLLKEIDNKYCKNEAGGTYNYDLRNRSTSHVHMMLSTALADMIDRCECIIFISTPNSFKPVDYLNSEGKTESPWIYSEIAMTRMIQQKTPGAHRPKPALESVTAADSMEKRSAKLKIEYPLDTFHLTPLSIADLSNWQTKTQTRGAPSLDALYSMKRK